MALAAPDYSGAAAATPAAAAPIVTATRQNAFTIPFRVETPQSPADYPAEVQLHVSTDGGATWQLHSRVKPDKSAFVYRAPHDGEYWYSIRTVDKTGVARPEGPLVAQLKVTVDTVAPRLDLSVTRGPAGEIVARWQAVDPNLKPDSFKLEYQTTSSGPWERVAVEAPPSAMRHSTTGEATWWPSAAEGPILVRAEVLDTGGNPAVSQAVAKPSDATSPVAPSTPQAPLAASNDESGWRPNTTPDPGTRDTTTWPPDRTSLAPLGSPTEQARSSRPPSSATTPHSAPPGFAPDETTPRTAARPVSQNNRVGGRPGSPLDFTLLPAAVRPRMVNSPNFEVDYEIESVGPSGVGKVELWGTRDGGRTWSDYATDADNRSPMPVQVDGEGIYGFRILVQSGSGYGSRPPAQGDMPDLWIGVDLTKPICRITAHEVSPDAAELLIRWEASDDLLNARPVTLLFSSSANGPWTPIASGLENTGSYRWRLDDRVPERILLRLEVRDEAGNVGIDSTENSIALDRYRPKGKIRGVRAINTSQ
ncbi:MAG: hypothetical protein DWQ37_06665 [Planctomycetota bacterium]|nr:MAG: hypothetical protein DWQ37_06665 [Planctomycetota bacterium]